MVVMRTNVGDMANVKLLAVNVEHVWNNAYSAADASAVVYCVLIIHALGIWAKSNGNILLKLKRTECLQKNHIDEVHQFFIVFGLELLNLHIKNPFVIFPHTRLGG